jgi:hypothetical protein
MNTTNSQLAFEERSRRAQMFAALGIWVAGAAVAASIAWRMDHPPIHRTSAPPATPTTSLMDWSVDGTGTAVEVDGTLLMPEDEIESHRPSSGVTIMQKP